MNHHRNDHHAHCECDSCCLLRIDRSLQRLCSHMKCEPHEPRVDLAPVVKATEVLRSSNDALASAVKANAKN